MYRIGERETEAIRRLIESKKIWRYEKDSETHQLEAELAAKLKSNYVLAVSSGTGALTAALAALEIGPGDEVIIPAYTFIATAYAVLAVGAVPVIANIDASLTLDPDDIEHRINCRTKAIIPVHINGLPCQMNKIMQIAERNNLKVVEDACQAMGGSYRGSMLGSIGDIGAFSFNYFKIIGCGEGGALITNNSRFFERARIYHDPGCGFFSSEHHANVPYFAGMNMRISDLLSAVMRVQLEQLDEILTDLRIRKHIIKDTLSTVDSIHFSPVNDPNGECSVKLGLLFESASCVDRILQKAKDTESEFSLECPYYTDKHVFINWKAVLERKGACTELLNPYRNSTVTYHIPDYNASLELLKRTLYIHINPSLSKELVKSEAVKLTKLISSL